LLRRLEADMRLRPNQDDVVRFATDVTYSMDRAKAAGFSPATDMHRGLALTVDWARGMGLAN